MDYELATLSTLDSLHCVAAYLGDDRSGELDRRIAGGTRGGFDDSV
jgi:hypothetical protein